MFVVVDFASVGSEEKTVNRSDPDGTDIDSKW